MKKFLSLALCAALVLTLAACSVVGLSGEKDKDVDVKPGEETQSSTLHHVSIDIADYGVIDLELDSAAAPITVANFLKLAEDGYYDGLTFHRIMEGFMMQGGAPRSIEEMADCIPGEFAANGWNNPISHTRGAISMARADDPDSANSQFFIVHEDSTFLDGNYAAFGHVTEGIEVVDAVCESSRPIDNNGTILPDEQPVITSVTVID